MKMECAIYYFLVDQFPNSSVSPKATQQRKNDNFETEYEKLKKSQKIAKNELEYNTTPIDFWR